MTYTISPSRLAASLALTAVFVFTGAMPAAAQIGDVQDPPVKSAQVITNTDTRSFDADGTVKSSVPDGDVRNASGGSTDPRTPVRDLDRVQLPDPAVTNVRPHRTDDTLRERAKEQTDAAREQLRHAVDTVKERAAGEIDTLRQQARERLDSLTDDEDADTHTVTDALRERIEVQKRDIADRQAQRAHEINARRIELQDRIEARRADIAARIDEQRRDVAESIKERIADVFEHMLTRFNAAIFRLETIAERIEKHMEELSEDDTVDLSAVRTQLEVAREAITAAGDAVDALASDIRTAVTQRDNVHEAVLAARDLLAAAKDRIKEAHSALIEAVRLLKIATGGDGEVSAADRCDFEMANARAAAARTDVCTAQFARLQCPHDTAVVVDAPNGCIISALEDRGWRTTDLQ